MSGNRFAIVIPARFGSSRFPGKPLARLKGADGEARTLIEHSWRAARQLNADVRVLVATDDDRIVEEATRFGAEVIMTSIHCRNGTERCAEVAEALSDPLDFIINLQGDAPLTPAPILEALVEAMADSSISVATPVITATPETRAHLVGDRTGGRVGGTTAVLNRRGHALYFSKEVLPFSSETSSPPPTYLHLGLYAYRPKALQAYMGSEPTPYELAEGLEQLRFLELGIPINTIVCPAPDGLMIELNNPEDVPLIEAQLQRRGLG